MPCFGTNLGDQVRWGIACRATESIDRTISQNSASQARDTLDMDKCAYIIVNMLRETKPDIIRKLPREFKYKDMDRNTADLIAQNLSTTIIKKSEEFGINPNSIYRVACLTPIYSISVVAALIHQKIEFDD